VPRRTHLVAAAVALAIGASAMDVSLATSPGAAAIKHVVVVMQENRTFD